MRQVLQNNTVAFLSIFPWRLQWLFIVTPLDLTGVLSFLSLLLSVNRRKLGRLDDVMEIELAVQLDEGTTNWRIRAPILQESKAHRILAEDDQNDVEVNGYRTTEEVLRHYIRPSGPIAVCNKTILNDPSTHHSDLTLWRFVPRVVSEEPLLLNVVPWVLYHQSQETV